MPRKPSEFSPQQAKNIRNAARRAAATVDVSPGPMPAVRCYLVAV